MLASHGDIVVTINPRQIPGRWRLGVALDLHTTSSEFLGHDEFGHAQYDTKRSEIGELLYKLKYSSDFSVVNEIAETAAMYVRQLAPSPYSFSPTLIVTVPPSRPRSRQPVHELASAIARKLGIPAHWMPYRGPSSFRSSKGFTTTRNALNSSVTHTRWTTQ